MNYHVDICWHSAAALRQQHFGIYNVALIFEAVYFKIRGNTFPDIKLYWSLEKRDHTLLCASWNTTTVILFCLKIYKKNDKTVHYDEHNETYLGTFFYDTYQTFRPILFLYYEDSLVHINSKLFRFYCVRPNVHIQNSNIIFLNL